MQDNNRGAIFRKGTREITSTEISSWYDEEGNWNGTGDLNGLIMSNKTPQFSWLAEGNITDTYRWRNNPVTGRREFHDAIDISNVEGTLVYTAAFGVIDSVGYSNVFGNYIWIRHGICKMQNINGTLSVVSTN
jgi:murein DD-endopeptidase MepM/ murein hydrolase activator NlpD